MSKNKTAVTAVGTAGVAAVNDIPPVQAEVVAEITLFKTKLEAVYKHDDTGDIILVFQKNPGKTAEPITVSEIAEELQKGIDNLLEAGGFPTIQLDFPWPEGAKEIADNLSITLKEVYLYIKIPKEGDKTIEYAFWMLIETSEALKEKFPIMLDSVSIKFWNTKNEKVLEEMDILDISALTS